MPSCLNCLRHTARPLAFPDGERAPMCVSCRHAMERCLTELCAAPLPLTFADLLERHGRVALAPVVRYAALCEHFWARRPDEVPPADVENFPPDVLRAFYGQ